MSLTEKQESYFRILGDRNRLREERLARTKLRSNVTSVSSNSKWEKIFEVLQTSLDKDVKPTLKLLKQENAWEYPGFLSSLFENTHLDGQGGPLSYNEIEWLEVESDVVPSFDFKVDMEIGEGFVVIYGYRVSNS